MSQRIKTIELEHRVGPNLNSKKIRVSRSLYYLLHLCLKNKVMDIMNHMNQIESETIILNHGLD